MRWAMCTDDIYNANRHLRGILDAGRTLPIKRSRGMEQPLFKVCATEPRPLFATKYKQDAYVELLIPTYFSGV